MCLMCLTHTMESCKKKKIKVFEEQRTETKINFGINHLD